MRERLDLEETVLIMIDMQNDSGLSEGFYAWAH
jgi:hypothetical protein